MEVGAPEPGHFFMRRMAISYPKLSRCTLYMVTIRSDGHIVSSLRARCCILQVLGFLVCVSRLRVLYDRVVLCDLADPAIIAVVVSCVLCVCRPGMR